MNINELEFNDKNTYHTSSLIAHCFTMFFSIVLIFFAFSVMIGWYGHIEALYRYQPGTIAIVFNTALCFALTSIALVSILYDLKYIPEVVLGLVFIICGLVVVQQLFDFNTGIDQFFLYHYDTIATQHPGRMAPNTVFCFFLSSVTLLILRYGLDCKRCVVISTLLSMVLFTLATIIIIGYISNLQEAYLWGNMTPMSSVAAVGFIILSSALISLSLHESIVDQIPLIRYLPFILALCIFVGGMILTVDVGEHEMLNHYSSSLPVTILVSSILGASLFGLLAFLTMISIDRAKCAKKMASILQTTIEASAEGIVVFNMKGHLVVHNRKFIEMWNLDESNMLNASRQSLIKDNLFKVANKEEYFLKTKRMAKFPAQEATDEIMTVDGKVIERHVKPQMMNNMQIGRVFSYRDITQQKKLEAQLMHQATYDFLTELPNRALLLDLINRNIETAKKNNSMLGLFLIDIDKFSHVNDLFGRSKGDMLLKTIATAIKQKLPPDCILGRIGGDEFMILSYNVTRAESAARLITTILNATNCNFNLYGHEIKVSCCIGVAFYPKDGQDTDVLLANADIAMLRAKKDGRNGFQFYTQDLNNYTLHNMQLEVQLHKAIEDKEFVVYYQPILDLKTLKPVGVEALVRWKNKEGVLVFPDDFISIAEDIGLIDPLGEFVLRTSCKQAQLWLQAGLPPLRIAVNISAHQFKSGNFARMVTDVLNETGMDPSNLDLELTEKVFIHSTETVSSALNELYELGVGISIDDFGTGYSSFNYVKKFPITTIKIDRGFVAQAATTAEDRAIVNAMILLAHSLNYNIVAEGIETKEQLDLLRSMDCDLCQGFLFAKALPADECTAFLTKDQ